MDIKLFETGCTGRYVQILEALLGRLGGVEVLRRDVYDDYQGSVEVDVLLKDGRVFSYGYNYGSCSGCDEWEDRRLGDGEIEQVMEQEATFFDSLEQYRAAQARKAS